MRPALASIAVLVAAGAAWLVPVVVAVFGLLGVVATALVAWLVNRRSTSGRVEPSDAATLWKASETIRIEQREEIMKLRERVAVLEDQGVQDRARIAALESELGQMGRAD